MLRIDDNLKVRAHDDDELHPAWWMQPEWLVSFSVVLGLGQIDNNNYIEPPLPLLQLDEEAMSYINEDQHLE